MSPFKTLLFGDCHLRLVSFQCRCAFLCLLKCVDLEICQIFDPHKNDPNGPNAPPFRKVGSSMIFLACILVSFWGANISPDDL